MNRGKLRSLWSPSSLSIAGDQSYDTSNTSYEEVREMYSFPVKKDTKKHKKKVRSEKVGG